jgi:hypothetical protein
MFGQALAGCEKALRPDYTSTLELIVDVSCSRNLERDQELPEMSQIEEAATP